MIQRQRQAKPVFHHIPGWLNSFQHRGLNPNSPEFHYYSAHDHQAQPVKLYLSAPDTPPQPLTMYYNIEREHTQPLTVTRDDSAPKDFSYLLAAETEEHLRIQVSKQDLVHDSSWVRKYEPTRFIDLLTDELHNRNVLTWLKSWDEIVFKRHQKKVESTPNIFRRGTTANTKFGYTQQEFNYKKLILLAGPPGCGKTTLARVVAKHCGYHYEQINASDDRSAKALITKIDNLTSNKTVGREQKPVCVIIDEVDGALDSDSNGIREVLQYLETGVVPGDNKTKITSKIEKGSKKQKQAKTEENKAESKPKYSKYSKYDHKSRQQNPAQLKQNQQRKTKIDRPVIFICNDPFVRGLKQLRGRAIVVYFSTLHEDRVVRRLRQITEKEDIYIESDLLAKICQMCNNDVRGCVSVLELVVKFKKQQGLAPKDVLTRLRFSFTKDSTTSTNEFLQRISSSKESKEKDKNGKLFTEYQHFIEQHDNPTLLFETFFHNLPHHKNLYYRWQTANRLYKQIISYDIKLRQNFGQSDQFSLLPYAYFHIAFKPDDQKKIQFPSAYFQRLTKLRTNKALLQKISKAMPPVFRVFTSAQTLTLHLLPMLWLTMQTGSNREVDILSCVYKMLTYGFKLAPRGSPHLFTPEIDQLLTFGGTPPEISLSSTSRSLMEENYEFLKLKSQLIAESILDGRQNYENVINQLKRNRRKNRHLQGGVVKYKYLEGTGTEIKYEMTIGYFFQRRNAA